MQQQSRQWSKRIAVTGGFGFIGSNLLQLLVPRYPDYLLVNIDSLTYAGNRENLNEVSRNQNLVSESVDIRDQKALQRCFDEHHFSHVIHLAAETHVDRSISGPWPFIETNIVGTFNLLEICREQLEKKHTIRFCHVTTDEVFGPSDQKQEINSRYNPSSPYAASKAASDHLVRAYCRTYGIDAVIGHASNNYGPHQYPEKLIPLALSRLLQGDPVPLFGDGMQERDWLYVTDHCEGIDRMLHQGVVGESYAFTSGKLTSNKELVIKLAELIAQKTGVQIPKAITFVPDRPGHDQRYALENSISQDKLGWCPHTKLDQGLSQTVDWYLSHRDRLIETSMSKDRASK